ncbi:MAG: hypothetical protein ACREF4_10540, partial [Gammaproteobacteria bacterium]
AQMALGQVADLVPAQPQRGDRGAGGLQPGGSVLDGRDPHVRAAGAKKHAAMRRPRVDWVKVRHGWPAEPGRDHGS